LPKGFIVASNSKDGGARAGRLEKAAQEGASAMAQYEAEGRALREKTARLRELRLAREAAEGKNAPAAKKAPAKKAAGKAVKKKAVPLSDFLDGQQKSGHRG
jgi:hypothetical protein